MLPIVVDSLDKVPENARGAYVARDGKHYLDAEIEDVSGLKAKNTDLTTRLTAAQKRAAILGDRTPEEIQADLDFAKEQREKAAKDAGDFEGLKKIQAQELQKRDAKIYELVAQTAADEAIAAAGGKVKKLRGEVLKHVKVMDVNGSPTAVVIDAAGKPRIKDGQGTAVTIADLVEELKADDDFAVDFAHSGASGSGARNGGAGGGKSGAAVIIPRDASPAEYRRLRDDAMKRGVPYKVAS